MLSDFKVKWRPIDAWPHELTKARTPAPFKAQWGSTARLLNTELLKLDAVNVVLEAALDDWQIKPDGSAPFAGERQKARHPGVVLSFDTNDGPLRIACDRFLDMYDNIRAIALGLHDLRRLERYGITQKGEQYTGWRRLPPNAGENGVPKPMTRDEAIATLARFAGVTEDQVRFAPEKAFKLAAARTHPDRGGKPEDFHLVDEARKVFQAPA